MPWRVDVSPKGSLVETSFSGAKIFAAALLLAAGALLAEPPASPKLAPLQFLVGSWEGEARPGEPSGTSTFAPDLQGTVLVRTNHASLPATGERPASVHDDLMVIYADPSEALRASDSEAFSVYLTWTMSRSPRLPKASPAPAAPRTGPPGA